MPMKNIINRSENFTGAPSVILADINQFLETIKKGHEEKSDFHLVHALVFSKSMNESEIYSLNNSLGDLYRKCGFDVLGGDTSTGAELSIFISTIVY